MIFPKNPIPIPKNAAAITQLNQTFPYPEISLSVCPINPIPNPTAGPYINAINATKAKVTCNVVFGIGVGIATNLDNTI